MTKPGETRPVSAAGRPWLIGLGICILIALGSAVQQSLGRWLQGGSLRLGEEMVALLPRFLVWGGLAGLVWLLSRAYPLAGRGALGNATVHVGGMAVFVLLQTLAFTLSDAVYTGARGVPRAPVFILGMLSSAPADILLYIGVLGVYHAVTYHRAFVARGVKDAQLETRLAQTELDALRTHLQPAFLFESLDAVAMLMAANVRAARKGLADLSELLRLSLNEGGGRPVRLAQEVELLERYFAVRALGKADGPRLHLAVSPAEADVLVAPALLQPIADALMQCPTSQGPPPTLELRVRRQEDVLRVELTAFSALPGADGAEMIAATSARLQRIYGTSAFLRCTLGGTGARVEVTLPASVDPALAQPPVGG
ncbi:MAG TPA: histidine kinase [Longimicrobiaceae bacterium]|nr:histidine kinase [Longimicrobiaceae bacterium]